MPKCHLGRAPQIQWQKFINTTARAAKKIQVERKKTWKGGAGSKPWKIFWVADMSLCFQEGCNFHKTPKLSTAHPNDVYATFAPIILCGHQPHDPSTHWQILGNAPVHQSDLLYPCSPTVKSMWLLSDSSRCPSVRLFRIQFGGSTWSLWCPSSLCPALFLSYSEQ